MGIFITFITAISISAVAAYYSIFGLIAIFSAEVMAIAIMGTVLEVGKLVAAAWCYNNWNETKALLKYPLSMGVIVLMLITSMGIFGFLSRAHIEQSADIANNSLKIVRVDQSIERHKRDIVRSEKVLNQFDAALDKFIELDYVTRSLNKRKEQESERNILNQVILTAETRIDELLDKKSILKTQIQTVETEVGPIRYIAAFVYDREPDTALLERAVRWVIIALIFVFDPMAILLLLAAQQSMKARGLRLKSNSGIIEDVRQEKKTMDVSVINNDSGEIEVKEVKTPLPPLKDLTKEQFNGFRDGGMLWEYYPEAEYSYEQTMEKLKKQTWKKDGIRGESYVK